MFAVPAAPFQTPPVCVGWHIETRAQNVHRMICGMKTHKPSSVRFLRGEHIRQEYAKSVSDVNRARTHHSSSLYKLLGYVQWNVLRALFHRSSTAFEAKAPCGTSHRCCVAQLHGGIPKLYRQYASLAGSNKRIRFHASVQHVCLVRTSTFDYVLIKIKTNDVIINFTGWSVIFRNSHPHERPTNGIQ